MSTDSGLSPHVEVAEASRLVFVARQPILDPRQNVEGYELLYRSGPEDFYSADDGDFATRSVIGHSLMNVGFADLTRGRRAFVNFTGALLAQQAARALPPERIVIEIAEPTPREAETLRGCWALKRSGYRFAFDQVVTLPEDNPFLVLADFVKVDFLRTGSDQRRVIARALAARSQKLIAEKVETKEDFAEARQLGFNLFQGNFFQQPEIVAHTTIPSSRLASLQLIKELN